MTSIDKARRTRPEVLPAVESFVRSPPPRSVTIYDADGAVADYPTAIVQRCVAVKAWMIADACTDDKDADRITHVTQLGFERDGAIETATLTNVRGGGAYDYHRDLWDWFEWHVEQGPRTAMTLLIDPAPTSSSGVTHQLLGFLRPYTRRTLREIVVSASAPNATPDRIESEMSRAIDVLHVACKTSAPDVRRALLPLAARYKGRTKDDFYLVGDLYTHFRAGNSILPILQGVLPALGDRFGVFWAAD